MRKLLLALLLLLLLPGQALAGPPEGVSGRMVLDEVADGLRCYRKETDPERRIAWLKRLAPYDDPRVVVALIDALGASSDDAISRESLCLLGKYVLGMRVTTGAESPDERKRRLKEIGRALMDWLEENLADLRRRAKELPR
jgi:hypothetical protein